MQRAVGWLWIIEFFGSLAAANAQTPAAPTPVTKYDGTYAFVSATKVNETYTDRSGRMKQCGNLSPRTSLTIENGHARFNLQQGTVASRGEFITRNMSPAPVGHGGFIAGWEIIAVGRIDENGAARARWANYDCSYDLIWQKASK
jgi:hypothetical protein